MAGTMRLKGFYDSLKPELPVDTREAGHFNIIRVQDTSRLSGKPVTYSRRSFFKMSVIRGRSNIHYAGSSYHIDSSALVFTNPLIPFNWELLDQEQEGYVCVFTDDFFRPVGGIGHFPVFQHPDAAVISLSAADFERFHNLFRLAYLELQGSYSFKSDLLRIQMLQVLHEAQKLAPAIGMPVAPGTAAARIAGLFLELLDRQFPIELSSQQLQLRSPADFAASLHIHVNHLNKALKEHTGFTTSQLIQSRLVQEAGIMLRSTDWSINDIAWSLGFEEANHFSSFFRGKMKRSPKQYRLSPD